MLNLDKCRRTRSAFENAVSYLPALLRCFASEHTIGESRVGKNDGSHNCGPYQQKNVAKSRGRGVPKREAKGHNIRVDDQNEAGYSQSEQTQSHRERKNIRVSVNRHDGQECNKEE